VTANQRLISCLLVAHLTALLITAVPSLDDFTGDEVRRPASEPVSPLTARLDGAADQLIWWHRIVYGVTRPLGAVVSQYIRLVGLSQKWNMFCNPAHMHQYARIAYRLRLNDGTVKTEYEQIAPAGPIDVVKLISAYFDSYMDKAMSNAFETYRTRALRAQASGMNWPTDEMVLGLTPYMEYFGHRREQRGLPAGARMEGVEFWWGTVPTPPPPVGTQPTTTTASSQTEIAWQLWAAEEWR
jgi:hypothetical protein